MTGLIACRRVLAVCFSLFLLSHCGGQTNFETRSNGSAVSSESGAVESLPVVGGRIEELTLDGDELELNLNIRDDESAVLLLVGLDSAGATQGFQLGTGTDGSQNLSHASSKRMLRNIVPEIGDATEFIHDELRELENKIPQKTEPAQPLRRRFATKSAAQKSQAAVQSRSFKVLNSFSANDEYVTVTAERAYQGSNFDIYVDERDFDAFPLDELAAVAGTFDDRVPDERDLFGNESDVDGDGKFSVLLTREINALGESYGGLITGYFYALDLFDAAIYPASNESEIIYALVPNPDGALGEIKVSYELLMNNILPGVLPHEFQHMANFNAHRLVNSTGTEASWLNEGLSHLAEDIYGIDESGYLPSSGIENPSRVANYLNNVDKTCFTCGSTLAQRGGAYLFLRYLYEQADRGRLTGAQDGMSFLWNLTDGLHRDIRNVANAIDGDPNGIPAFQEALASFGLTLYLSGSDQDHDDDFEISGLNLRSFQDDNRGTVLNGPAILNADDLPLVETLSGYSLAYVQISGASLNSSNGKLDLKVADGDKFKAYLIQ